MPVIYPNLELLHSDDFADFLAWHHEGIGTLERSPDGGLRLHCNGSQQGAHGCMAFFRPTLPDQIAVEYDLIVRSQGGLIINYIAIRGLNGEDLITDTARLPARTGIMPNYYLKKWGLQSYHVSISRFDDTGKHSDSSNWRRNPGLLMAAQGVDLVQQIDRQYHIRIVKDRGHCQLFVDGQFAHSLIDRDISHHPIPDHGKFGFRIIGSNVMADIAHFRVYRVETCDEIWADADQRAPVIPEIELRGPAARTDQRRRKKSFVQRA